ncbi:single-stranded-DNA-specific exonuclease RecJ [Petroclostridium sp. X23]|uniref:single-stranded-DNA-specific exonuclease RecJ n=1 Tax=Petroclostridium sp. X23 TaxID=3045146 RepID=UPI0024AE03A0|nr:single-stranded-DNA-specific exonuclease RecJ [Petroclostridium sp. X23]WHH59064.1 single-stranded-DNA-specific exonuclease RecJ [Petroclostridium sp. X23]
MNYKKWVYQQPNIEAITKISDTFGVSPIAAAVVYNRGIRADDDIEVFLKKEITDLHSPFLMKDMDKAVKRVKDAIHKNEKITVYGDYDVDGVTSTAILVKYLRSCGADVGYYIPDRIDEGYGVNMQALQIIKNNGTSLVITVDSGVTAIEEIKYAAQLGLDVIVTDHHECKEDIPQCCAVLNPKQKECSYPFKDLAGVGVTFKLIQGLSDQSFMPSIIDEYCDIVCLGTIADVVPLLGENRLIVNNGLKKMKHTCNIGLKSLIRIAGLKDKQITTGVVGFMVAPRINAAGRIGSALRAVDLFLTEDEELADEISNELNEENKNRQATEAYILQEALETVQKEFDFNNKKVIVLAGENWHHGVIGIVASRITEKFYRPSILISFEGNEGKGSGRSVSRFNLFKALDECKQDLVKYGGHELAAGLSVQREKIDDFIKHINEYADKNMNEDDLIPRIKIDYEVGIQDLNIDTIKDLEVLEPFGMGNANPVFSFTDAVVADIRTVGDNKHLKVILEKNGGLVDAIGFNMGEYAQHFINGDIIDVACCLDINAYNGQEKVQLVMKDIKLNDQELQEYKYLKDIHMDREEVSQELLHRIIPERQDFVMVYQYIKTRSVNGSYSDHEFLLNRRIAKSYNTPLNYLKMINILEIFQELGLLRYSIEGEQIYILICEQKGKKVNIESSNKLINLRRMKKTAR